jgi:hypothetical protein
MRKKWLLVLAAVALALAGLTFLALPRSSSARARFSKLRHGMTLPEVEAIMGSPGREFGRHLQLHPRFPFLNLVECWDFGRHSAVVGFTDDGKCVLISHVKAAANGPWEEFLDKVERFCGVTDREGPGYLLSDF